MSKYHPTYIPSFSVDSLEDIKEEINELVNTYIEVYKPQFPSSLFIIAVEPDGDKFKMNIVGTPFANFTKYEGECGLNMENSSIPPVCINFTSKMYEMYQRFFKLFAFL